MISASNTVLLENLQLGQVTKPGRSRKRSMAFGSIGVDCDVFEGFPVVYR